MFEVKEIGLGNGEKMTKKSKKKPENLAINA